jgi:MATE family multidrug resistance protein
MGSPYSSSPVAAASLARDLSEYPLYDQSDDDSESEAEPSNTKLAAGPPDVSMAGSYRRPSITAVGPRPTVLPAVRLPEGSRLPKGGWEAVKNDERSLLRDNHVLPQRQSGPGGLTRLFSRPSARGDEPTAVAAPTETSALLGGEEPHPEAGIAKQWEEAVLSGRIQTTWQREAKTLGRYSRSLIVTFILQYSLTIASVFTVGHLGKVPLGAVSLASMTSNITGYAIYQGLATSLDTLCAQAYGSGRKKLVGLQLQRMVYFLWVITIPIGIVWLSAGAILRRVVPDPELGDLAGQYLRILLIGAPGYACFESGKRYLQAQGLFNATLHVLLFCAPLNAFMNWLFVWVSQSTPCIF